MLLPVYKRNLLLLYCRYRKFNLFGEKGFSTTPEADISILDTDFGVKFGIFTYFDLIFKKPAVKLVKEWGVTDIVFPTAWFSELPFLSGKCDVIFNVCTRWRRMVTFMYRAL
jgi:hypothetical protein